MDTTSNPDENGMDRPLRRDERPLARGNAAGFAPGAASVSAHRASPLGSPRGDHWFDEFTKMLAGHSVSRRVMLRRTAQSTFAAFTANLVGGIQGMLQAAFAAASPGCTLTQSGAQTVISLQTSGAFQGISVDLSQTITITAPPPQRAAPGTTTSQPAPTTVARTTVTSRGALLLDTESSTSGGTTQVRVRYGEAFRGIREGSFTSTNNGRTVEGEIDGRRIVPLSVPPGAAPGRLDVSTLRFADGRPAPPVALDSTIRAALEGIFRQAQDQLKSCSRRRAFRALAYAPRGGTGTSADSGPLVAMLSPGACDDCQWTCAEAMGVCLGGFAAGCIATLFGYGACVAAGVGICVGTEVTCTAACFVPGVGPCCKTLCGGPKCCTVDEICNEATSGCCAKDNVICGGQCCAPPNVCTSNVCCPQGVVVCKGGCCKPGEACSNENICCPQGVMSCGGKCCANSSQVCQAGVCCEPGRKVCNGVCCPAGGVCDGNGNCCTPPGCHLCGKVSCLGFDNCCDNTYCCPADSVCLNGGCCPKNRSCVNILGARFCCPAGTRCDQSRPNNPCVSCPPGTTQCAQEKLCCPPNTKCCFTQCCKPPLVCCGPGKLCVTQTQCVQ